MPNHFQLFRKDSDSKEAVPLNKIDEELCAYFNIEVHPKKYALGWYDNIGLHMAMCGDLDKIVSVYEEDLDKAVRHVTEEDYDKEAAEKDPTWHDRRIMWSATELQIAKWFQKNFTLQAWATVGW